MYQKRLLLTTHKIGVAQILLHTPDQIACFLCICVSFVNVSLHVMSLCFSFTLYQFVCISRVCSLVLQN